MDKRGVEEAGPAFKIETIIMALLSIAVLIFLILIFRQLFA